MTVYTCTELQGIWPVGTAAVVIAQDRGHAKRLLEAEAKSRGLTGATDSEGTELKLDDILPVSMDYPHAVILLDGDY